MCRCSTGVSRALRYQTLTMAIQTHPTCTMRSSKRCVKHLCCEERPLTKKTRKSCSRKGFLDLPRELRDMIYELSLVSTERIDVCRLGQFASPPSNTKLGISTALLRVSRQIHSEGVKVMYGLNTFEASIFLDPRIPHSFHQNLEPLHLGRKRRFTNPMIQNVKRLMIRLKFTSLSRWPSHDPWFPSEMLQAFVLDGHLDLIALEPDSFCSYFEGLQHFKAALATANAAVAVARGSLFSAHLLSCVGHSNKSTLVVCTPQPRPTGYFRFLDFPWTRLDAQSTNNAVEILCHIPSRFSSTGQMKSAGSTG